MEAATKYGCRNVIYCFMPDHLHVILRGLTAIANAKSAMDSFKSSSGYWFADNAPDFEWQLNYHDHVVRSVEDFGGHVRYIAENPVRSGLVSDILDYPHTGSEYGSVFDLLLDLEMGRRFGSQ